MMSNEELEAALNVLAALVDANVENVANIAIGSTTLAMVMLQYKSKMQELQSKLEGALARIETLENGTPESTIEEANS